MGGTSCIAFNNSDGNPTKVFVRIPTRNVQTNFAGIIGSSDVAVGSHAEAELGTEVNCSLCFLGSIDAENADFSVFGGSIAVNGNVNAGPNSYLDLRLQLHRRHRQRRRLQPGPDAHLAVQRPAGEPCPPAQRPVTAHVKTNPCTQGPGIYNARSRHGNNVACILTPGSTSSTTTWSIGQQHPMTLTSSATGVTIFVPKPRVPRLEERDHQPQGADDGAFKDLAVVYSRDNTNPFSIQGNGAMGSPGRSTPRPRALDFNGNSDSTSPGARSSPPASSWPTATRRGSGSPAPRK